MRITIHDAEHWITVHPNGREDKGEPLLIEGSNGHYVVKGGAGGKLNGQTINPSSMSKARAGTEGGESNTSTQPNTKPAAAPAETKTETSTAPATSPNETKTEPNQHPDDVQNQTIADIEKKLKSVGAEQSVIQGVIEQLKTNPALAPKDAGQWEAKHWSNNQVKQAINNVHENSVSTAGSTTNTPTMSPSQARYEEKREKLEAEAKKADELSSTAKTLEEHQAAMQAHYNAYINYKPWSISRKKELNHHATEYHKHKKEIKRLEKEAKKGQPRVKREPPKGTSFAKSSVEQIKEHFTKEWGMGFDNGVKKGAALAYAREHNIWSHSSASSEEEKKKHSEEYLRLREHERSDPSYGLKGHTPIDINANTPSAKAMREMLTHVDNSLKQLEASGFNPKTALKKANVSFVAGTTGRANGHAWGGNVFGEGTSGYFSVSPFKRGTFNEDQAAMHKARMEAGKPRWSVSSSEADQTRGTIIHEMTHALGMRHGVESPKRLTEALNKALPNMNYADRKKWITENISEYATKNIKETDAELCAMVTAPDYKWGTLPKPLEDHVKWLWDYKDK